MGRHIDLLPCLKIGYNLYSKLSTEYNKRNVELLTSLEISSLSTNIFLISLSQSLSKTHVSETSFHSCTTNALMCLSDSLLWKTVIQLCRAQCKIVWLYLFQTHEPW